MSSEFVPEGYAPSESEKRAMEFHKIQAKLHPWLLADKGGPAFNGRRSSTKDLQRALDLYVAEHGRGPRFVFSENTTFANPEPRLNEIGCPAGTCLMYFLEPPWETVFIDYDDEQFSNLRYKTVQDIIAEGV